MSIGRIGTLGSYSGMSQGTQYGVPPQILAMAYQAPYGRLTKQVPSPWKPINRIGKSSYGSAPMEWVTPLSTPLDARQNLDLIRAAASTPRVQDFRSRQPTVAAFGRADFGAMRDPMGDKQTGAQGTVFSPGWFADLFTISPAEAAARQAKRDEKKRQADAKRQATTDYHRDLKTIKVTGKADAKVARASRAKGKSAVSSLSPLVDTASGMLKSFTGGGGNASVNQPTGSDVGVPPDSGAGEPAALPVFVKPLAAAVLLSVIAAIGYKMLHKKNKRSGA